MFQTEETESLERSEWTGRRSRQVGEKGLVSGVHRQAGEGGVRRTGWLTDTLKSEL